MARSQHAPKIHYIEPVIRDRIGYDPYWEATLQYERTAGYLDLEPWIYQRLKHPQREITVHLAVTLDDGRAESFTGYRVQHSMVRGPAKGGIRYSPDASLNECKALAMWMTWKCSLLNLPLGGGKGAVICDPFKMSENELHKLTTAYTRAIRDVIGPYKDIPAPDMFTNAQTMAWIAAAYNEGRDIWEPGVVTGKPVHLWGSLGRSGATGTGLFICLREAAKHLDFQLQDRKVAILGFGNVGSSIARLTRQAGCRIVAVTDLFGGVYNPDGIDPFQLQEQVDDTGSVVNFPGTSPITNDDLIALPCDVLIPAATEGQIRKDNAEAVRARIILEGANGPTTLEADEILNDKGVLVVPDILANAGGVVVSYLEWVQDLQRYFFSEEEILSKTERMMTSAFWAVVSAMEKQNVSMRDASYLISVGRVAEALRTLGNVV